MNQPPEGFLVEPTIPPGSSAPVGLEDDFVEVIGSPIWIDIPTRSIRARVTSMNPYALRAVLPHLSSWVPRVGDSLGTVHLEQSTVQLEEADDRRTFDQACLIDCEIADGSTVIQIAVDPDRTTGALWALHDRFRHGATTFDAKPPEGWRPPKIPARGIYTEAARLERLAWITEQTGADMTAVRETSLDPTTLTGNIEGLVSGVEVPVGLAGPLWFNGEHAKGLIVAPFGTTEGTLVASATRGATAMTRAGGVTTRVLRQQMMRVPTFFFDDSASTAQFVRWVMDHVDHVRQEVAAVSKRAILVKLDPIEIGNQVHLRFVYETGDAAGQNMTTACTWRACQWITRQLTSLGLPSGRMIVEGGAAGDKRVNYLSFVDGRGIRVIAECFIDGPILSEVLKVTPESLEEGAAAFMAGSLQIGGLGFDINISNVVAAIFTATGQDIACAHESSLGILTLRKHGDGIHATMTMPALIVGTVGGGTSLSRQRSFLEMMGCAGTGKVRRLAEIIAGYALALDLSTLAAIVSGQFANAHERLGRNKPVEWFTREDLSPALLQSMLAEFYDDPTLTVTGLEEDMSFELGSSIITELTAQKAMRKLVGFTPLRVELERNLDGTRLNESVELMVKSKPIGDEVAMMMAQLASLCGGAVASEFARWQQYFGFNETHQRELHLAQEPDERMARITPRVYGIHCDPDREAYLLISENFAGKVILRDTADDVSPWELRHLEIALSDMAKAHAVWLGRTQELLSSDWIGPVPNATLTTEMIPLWHALAAHAATEFPEWFDADDTKQLSVLIDDIPLWWGELDHHLRTLIHNDFNPRNICLRIDDQAPSGYRLLAYDWELATVHVPQRDLAELLAFTLGDPVDPDVVGHLVELHRKSLEEASGVSFDPATWRRGYALALNDFTVQRLSLYLMAHTFRDFHFLGRVLTTTRALIDIEREHGTMRQSGNDR